MGKKTRQPKKRPFLRAVFISAGLVLIADTAFVLTRTSLGLGTLMPAILGLGLLLCGLFMPALSRGCAKSRLLRAGAFVLSLLYALFAALFTLTTVLILACSTAPEDGADALIVLGGGIRGRSPSLILKYRLDAALDYLERNPDTVCIVSGGQGRDEVTTEAEVMKNYLLARGLERTRLLIEDRSLSTEENFEFSKKILDELFPGGAETVFVTTRFHVFRSERTARRAGLPAEGIPARGVWYIAFNDYLRECAAITVYFITGRM